ncbi:MAG TPA: FmdB family zinc ribbon protein [Mycobacteriales bacterium]|jgi:putative FmdB family regulatory protein|nr:FmdB family zinc ribbon protein [Mycobacteriales bacterium]HVX70391.1 FmdB family zinc ribbon protein [Mycobacteriales bacterium]
MPASGVAMPIYLFRCAACDAEHEELLELGATGDRRCPECGGTAKHRFSRVAVKYDGWGFSATDKLVGDNRGKDFKQLRAKAEEISDS